MKNALSISAPLYQRVVLLTSDATGAELVSDGTAPQWSQLIRSGMHCSRTYAHGNPTQFSFPSIMTSSLPLDHGGYDWGVRDRPVTLAESMRRAGFATYGFSTTVWLSSLYGYARGFDRLFAFHNPVASWNGSLNLYLAYWTQLFDRNRISREVYLRQMENLLDQWFRYLRAHCDGDSATAKEVPVLNYNRFRWQNHMRGVRDRLSAEHDQYMQSACKYIENRGSRLSRLDLRNLLQLPRTNGDCRYVPAKTTFDSILEVLKQVTSRPVFVWAHFRDVHDFESLPQPSNKAYGRRTREGALAYWDHQLERFLHLLRQASLDDGCLLVVFSDHGSAAACSLSESSLRVPLVFWSHQIKPQKINTPCGLWDLAPSVLDLNGMKPEKSFQGTPVRNLDGARSRLLVAEHSGRGPCDLTRKKINLAVTDGHYKRVFSETKCGNDSNTFSSHVEIGEGDIPHEIDAHFVEVFQQRCRRVRAQVAAQ